MTSGTGQPSSAASIAGGSSSASGFVPNRARSVSQPLTQPGTDQLSGPSFGIWSSPFSAKTCRVSLYGLRPLALRP